jgi:predicted NAD/FAD-dependent oxidoreductase
LIQLNHRYALDGSDPNSYGGLLWTLGLFDRPFPEQAVVGRLRSRSTGAHARRLNTAHYRSRVTRPSSSSVLRIGVVGAGIAGLAAARTLQDHGHQVTVFEKSRGPGGRCATRRYGDIGFDHGAQYFTARDPAFRRAVDAWQEVGIVTTWPARMATVVDGRISPSPDDQQRFVAVPGMNALGKHLAADLDVQQQIRVAPPQREATGWLLRSDEDKVLGTFDALIIATPAPQAVPLLQPHAPALARIAEGIVYDPMWAAMLHVDGDDPVGFDGLFVKHGPIGWAARNHGKPGRQGTAWIVHASAAWSREHLDRGQDTVAAQLGRALADLLGLAPAQVRPTGAHRWLYSLASNPLRSGTLWQTDIQLAACGDWCSGARIEGAYLSGIAAAGRVLADLHARAE